MTRQDELQLLRIRLMNAVSIAEEEELERKIQVLQNQIEDEANI